MNRNIDPMGLLATAKWLAADDVANGEIDRADEPRAVEAYRQWLAEKQDAIKPKPWPKRQR